MGKGHIGGNWRARIIAESKGSEEILVQNLVHDIRPVKTMASITWRASARERQRLCRDNPFAFLDRDELVRFDLRDGVFVAARPNNFHTYRLAGFWFAQAES